MRYLIPFTLIPLLSHAATLGGADGQWNGGDKNGGQGGNYRGGDGQWTGIPDGQTNYRTWSGRPQGSAPAAPPAPAASSIAPSVPSAPAAPPAWSPAPDTPPAAVPSPAAPASSPYSPPAAAVPTSILPVLPFATPASIPSIIPGGAIISAMPMPSSAPIPTAAPFIPSGTGLIAPSSGDKIPAAQCSPGGKPGGPWLPFVRAQQSSDPNAQCPTDSGNNISWFLDSDKLGCCPQNAYITTARRSQWACCPCGSSCAGLPPVPFQDWSISTGKLFVGGSPYTIPAGGIGVGGTINAVPYTTNPANGPNAPSPTTGPNVVKGPNGSGIQLSFTPTSSSVTCNVIGCQTLYYGPNTVATLLAPAGGVYISTTATAVLFGTVSGKVIPTFTTYAVVTAEGGAAAARPTGLVGVGVVGALAGLAAAIL